MKVFHCDHCGQLVFFENVQCVACGHTLAFEPGLREMVSLEADGAGGWRTPHAAVTGRQFRLCANYSGQNICNWLLDAGDPQALCPSCRLTTIIPDLLTPGNHEAWYRLEIAKRRLVYTLSGLQLPIADRAADPAQGLAFEFKSAAAVNDGSPVLTGHADGVITVNLEEADDAERERRRLSLHEPYRTLLGHFRHEIGHYYWDRLVRDDPARLDGFRALFGDERADYSQALQQHYQHGSATIWQDRFVSAYASSHPWEDWAETWAHYLHMVDTLETATACGLSLRPARSDEPALQLDPQQDPRFAFERMIDQWFPLTYALNSLNRGLGQPDAYPFVLPLPVIDKLRFVHGMVHGAAPSSTR